MVYLDNILIFTETLDKLQKVTDEVLKALEEYDLKLNSEKCEWEKETISFLGYEFQKGKKMMNKGNVANFLWSPHFFFSFSLILFISSSYTVFLLYLSQYLSIYSLSIYLSTYTCIYYYQGSAPDFLF